MDAITTLQTVPDSHAVTVLATDDTGALVTQDTSWRDAIARYDADVASGVIQFNAAGFADKYPGEASSDASLESFFASKVDAL